MRLGQRPKKIEHWLEAEKERLPLWIPVGMGCGIAIWELFWGQALWPLIVGFVCLAVISRFFAAGGVFRNILLMTAATLLCGYGLISFKSYSAAHQQLEKPWYGEFYGRIVKSEHLPARQKYRLTLETDGHADLPEKLRVNLSPDQYQDSFRSGAIVRMRARLMPPAPPALPGGYDFARRAWFAELGATGTALGEVRLHQASPSGAMLEDVRRGLSGHIRQQMAASPGSIAAALATGDRGAISDEDATAMRESGMAHLLSISGLHVTAIVGAVFLFFSRLLSLIPWFALRYRVPIIAASLAALAALGYTMLTGAQVPTIRSCVAALLILTALALGREVLSLRMVAAGAIFVMMFWPETIAGPSFQLSFAAVSTIIVLHEHPVMKRLMGARSDPLAQRIGRGILSLLLTGLAIEIVLAPIALFHFHKTGLYGALANVIAIPLTTFIVMPFEFLALIFDGIGLGAPFWWVTERALNAILFIAHYVSALPGAVTMRPEMPFLAYAAIILGGLWLFIFTQRERFYGALPVLLGFVMLAAAGRPDLLITGDGKHLALIDRGNGATGDSIASEPSITLLRSRAGDYTRDTLRETAGIASEPKDIADFENARCSPDSCVVEYREGKRNWRILATRTPYLIPAMELAAACKRVDIVVSDRRLPYSCKPAWVKLDRRMLEQTGGIAVYLDQAQINSVNKRLHAAPWMQAIQRNTAKRIEAAKRRREESSAKISRN